MTIPASNSPQLTPENLRELEAAQRALVKIRRAGRTALLEGFTVAIFGGLTAICGKSSIAMISVGLVLLAIGVVEIIGGNMFRRLDPRAARILVVNQLTLAVVILVYALWMLHHEIAHPLMPISASDAQVLGITDASTINFLSHDLLMVVYFSLIAAAVVEACMAMYYHRRGIHLRRYLDQTPQWIVSMQKARIWM